MAFEDITPIGKPATSKRTVPPKGVAIMARRLGLRHGGIARYIAVTVGPELARGISLTQPEHRVRLLIGSGGDAGKVQVSVDNAGGKFRAKRAKSGCYQITINAATADGRFALEFPAFTETCEAIRPQNGQPPHFVFHPSAAMLAVED